MRAPTDTGAEIWQHSLLGAITLEAEAIAELTEAPAGSHGTRQRRRLRDRIVAEMTETLTTVGDRYTAPDGVRYSLVDDKGAAGVDTLRGVTAHDPVVTDVIEFQTLPAGDRADPRGHRPLERRNRKHSACLVRRRDPIPSRQRRAAVRGVERGECRVMSMFMTSNPRRARCPASPS